MKALVKPLNSIVALQELPQAAYSGNADNVLLKVLCVGLCRTDLYVAQGIIPVDSDITVGHEFVALVVQDATYSLTGKRVGINPLYPNHKFMGVDFNGALCQYIEVPRSQVIPTTCDNDKVVAYLEPVAASMAVLNAVSDKQLKGAVYGNNRIAYLTWLIAKDFGLDVEILDDKEFGGELTEDQHNKYDYIIETVFEEKAINNMMKLLKEGGKLIVKSRKRNFVGIDASLMVAKNLTFQAVNYYDFPACMAWLEEKHEIVHSLLGNSYDISQWQDAFDEAQRGEAKKIFIHFEDE